MRGVRGWTGVQAVTHTAIKIMGGSDRVPGHRCPSLLEQPQLRRKAPGSQHSHIRLVPLTGVQKDAPGGNRLLFCGA